MDRGSARQDDAEGKEQRRSRSRGETHSTYESTELRDHSVDAQESMVYRLFSKLEKRIETQWQEETTTELKSTVLELDNIQRDRMHRMEQRQAAVE